MIEQRTWHFVRWRSLELNVESYILEEFSILPGKRITDEQCIQIQNWIECGFIVNEYLVEIQVALSKIRNLQRTEDYQTWVRGQIARGHAVKEWEAWKRMTGSAD